MDIFRSGLGKPYRTAARELEQNRRARRHRRRPGDISWAMHFEEARADFRFIESLNGKKILLKGNHDYWWQTNAKNRNFLESEGLRTITIPFNDAVRAEDFIVCGTRGWFCRQRLLARGRQDRRARGRTLPPVLSGGGKAAESSTAARFSPSCTTRSATAASPAKLAAAVATASAAAFTGICTAFRARGCILPARACGPSWSRPTSFSSRRCAFFREKALDKPERLCYTIPNR